MWKLTVIKDNVALKPSNRQYVEILELAASYVLFIISLNWMSKNQQKMYKDFVIVYKKTIMKDIVNAIAENGPKIKQNKIS